MYLLFHYNMMSFIFLFEWTRYSVYLSFSGWNNFKTKEISR
jgi:hypothetical protein